MGATTAGAWLCCPRPAEMWLWGSSLSCGMFYNYKQQLGHCAGPVCLQDDAAARLARLVTFDILELAMVDGTRAGEGQETEREQQLSHGTR